MSPVLAQATEITNAARSWGDQLPALGLGLLGFGILVYLFLKRLKEMGEESRSERESQDTLFAETIKEVSDRADARAQECHAVQREASVRAQETAEVLGAVRGALDRSVTVTMDLGHVLQEARR